MESTHAVSGLAAPAVARIDVENFGLVQPRAAEGLHTIALFVWRHKETKTCGGAES